MEAAISDDHSVSFFQDCSSTVGIVACESAGGPHVGLLSLIEQHLPNLLQL